MNQRILSIDILRALTMVLMIWVNDFWTLQDIPYWLQHMKADEDALGFSDIIFPAFLFIVGLSIPYAIQARRNKGDSNGAILGHIVTRSVALLVMGLYMVNLESYHEEASGMSKALWQVLMIVGFVLIWNVYRPEKVSPAVQAALKLAGIAILLWLALVFRSDPANGYNWLEPHWWGILGLIGWAYLSCAVVQLYFGHSLLAVAGFWLFFMAFNVAHFAGWLTFLSPLENFIWLAGNGAMAAFTMAGCLVSTLYRQKFSDGGSGRFLLVLVVLGLATLAAGFLLRPPWGISKILGTPAWTEICTGISILAFALFYWLVDIRGINLWPRILQPAGLATLTCYLVPYVVYPTFALLPFALPDALTTGAVGLAKSMLFAVFIVVLTGGLNRLGIKLKI